MLKTKTGRLRRRECEKENMEVVIMNGNNLENLQSYFAGENFAGTKIH